MKKKNLKKLKKLLDDDEMFPKLINIPWKTPYSDVIQCIKTDIIAQLLKDGTITISDAITLMTP